MRVVNGVATEINDCVNNHLCGSNGTCVDRVLGYLCNCSVGFTGTHCETGNAPSTC